MLSMNCPVVRIAEPRMKTYSGACSQRCVPMQAGHYRLGGLLPTASRVALAKPFQRAISFSKPPGLVSQGSASQLIYGHPKYYGTR
jgi:hypothetical protein